MSEHEKYEAVVVGAGPAGLAAAMELSRNGVQTLVLERGKEAGTKAITGGILYGQTNTPYNLDYLLPDFEKKAPVERPVDEYLMHAVSGDKTAPIDLGKLHQHEMKWAYSILRHPFDRWFADEVHQEARKNDGGVLTNIHVKGPLLEGGEVVGVETEELDPIRADLVIAADGVASEMVRQSGLRPWGRPDEWFQGVKVVVRMDESTINERFNVSSGEGAAHLFAGDLFQGVRGGGFLYTNRDTLSIGTVFHLDSLMENRLEPHRLLDKLLDHPLMTQWIGDDYEELEYSAKLVPDGKKMGLKNPYKGQLLAVGDAAGQMQAQGPVIKGMNLGITSGILAARGYLEAKQSGNVKHAGPNYGRALAQSYIGRDLRPRRYGVMRALFENSFMDAVAGGLIKSGLGRAIIKSGWGRKRVENMMASPFWAGAMPDINVGYSTLPMVYADVHGEARDRKGKYVLPDLDERIAALNFDTAVGKPHIKLLDNSPKASGAAVWTCPVSAQTSSRGCYRRETVKLPDGGTKDVIALDVQPCIECGTCGIAAETDWVHPPGGKGVQLRYG